MTAEVGAAGGGHHNLPRDDTDAQPTVRSRVAAVVLAGGRSRRFGTDKLRAPLDGVPLLQHAIGTLPADWSVILVGPPRSVADREVITVREQQPGSGPAAALVAGFAAALRHGAEVVVTLPGDAPGSGSAAIELVDALTGLGPDDAVVGIDADGVEQPLQLALTGTGLHRLAARTDVADLGARRLLADLDGYHRLPLPPELVVDVDTPDDLARLSSRKPRISKLA